MNLAPGRMPTRPGAGLTAATQTRLCHRVTSPLENSRMPTPRVNFNPSDVEYAGVQLRGTRYKSTPAAPRHDDGMIDEVAVRRKLDGGTVDLSGREFAAAVAVAVDRGLNDSTIAERLGVTNDAILKTRQRHGIESPYVDTPDGPGTRATDALDRMPRRDGSGFRRHALNEPLPLVYSPTFGSGDTRHRRRRSRVQWSA